jgi:uncharacterized protein
LAKRNKPFKDKLRDAIWPRMGIRRYVTYLKNKVLRLSATPHAIAAGVASGAAVSCFPFVGLHFFLGFVLAYFVRGNMLAAAIGTAWGNPITFPFLFSAAYQLGSFILSFGGSRAPVDLEAEAVAGSEEVISQGLFSGSFEALLPTIGTMCVGATPIALVTFGVFYGVVYSLVTRFKARRKERLLRRALLHGEVSDEQ